MTMSNKSKSFSKAMMNSSWRKGVAGFSLIELMVAMSIFMVVGGAVVALIRRHVPLFNTAQNQAGLNVSLRNAVAQLQMEVVNAGSSYSVTNPMPFWPIGATITPATTPIATCQGTQTYVAACFDSFSLIDADSTVPALAPSVDSAGLNQIDTNTTTTLFLTFPGNPAGATSNQYQTWAAALTAGTELMLVQGGTDMPAGQPEITVVVVQAPGATVANGSSLSVPILSSGTVQPGSLPTGCPNAPPAGIKGIPAADQFGIYNIGECLRFTSTFNPQLDYAIKLNSTTYSVDGSDPTDPKLIRTSPTGTVDVIADQIVGFNVGAWSSVINGYSKVPGAYNSDWASIRSLQIQLIARTAPNSDGATFRNTYDQGPYQVQGVSVVINPRNLNSN
jgi:prepilin-type N-terminal cleavage/methylation domain-containing protein